MVYQPCLKFGFALSILVGLLSIAGITVLVVLWQTKLTPFQDYAVVVDAGSTHSKIFIYTWPADKSDGLGLTSRVTQVKSCTPAGGAITTIKDPTETNVEKYFNSSMHSCIDDIPANRKDRALIFLGGTAGLRLFEMKNLSYTNALLNGTRAYFSTLGLLFRAPESQVRIISGSEEGLSGWISANMLMGELFKNNKPLETYGVSDMGGASTQLSFISPDALYHRFNMSLFNTDYETYSHSYLCYGAEQFRYVYLGQMINAMNGSQLINDPCLQNGYTQNFTYNTIFSLPCVQNRSAPLPYINTSSTFTFIGTGNYSTCSSFVQERYNTSVCTTPNCSFDNVYQPKPIASTLKFIAISAWYSTFRTLAPNVTLSPDGNGNYNLSSTNFTQIRAAIKAICEQSWSDVPQPDPYRPLLCFNSMHHWTLLEYGYGMTNDNLKNFQIIRTVNSNEIGWTLGYMINQTNYLDAQSRPERLLTKAEFGGLLGLCSFCLLVSIIIGIITMYHIHQNRN
ncbi:unnamed protein product [Adineta steineri]|uniref:Uncharacterized protein n=1 Tax=Adineta steineri TaxID=433720 RepID=A0A815L4Y0_9BILA|nr:unnamed protein product [Adineta steineri]CAF1398639.1 unnamed protein product [Adineta steineri]